MSTQKISFNVAGDLIIGHLYYPENISQGSLPAIIVAGPMTSVKEQVTGRYAKELSQHGFITLSIDHRHYGESGGEPRQFEYYKHKIEDLSAAIDYLKSLDIVDSERIHALGICLGSGYLAHTLKKRTDLRSFSAIAGYYRDVEAMMEEPLARVSHQEKIEQGLQARIHYELTGEVKTIPAVSLTEEAAMMIESTYHYYASRAAHSNYTNKFAVMSREHFITFDVQEAAQDILIPTQIIHGNKALNPTWAKKFYSDLKCPKEWLDVEADNQTAYYDDSALLALISQKVSTFISRH